MKDRQPAVFLPHGGGPCFFMEWNPPDTWARQRRFLEDFPASLPTRPTALLVISGHWEERVFTVQTNPAPPLLFDYQGFPPHTYQLTWTASGDPALAARVRGLLEDAGFETGDRVPSNYDSMIAKLIVSGGDRDEAVDLLVETLAHTQLSGVPANTGFLRRCAQSDAFRDGTHHVNWIAEQGDALTHSPSEHQHASVLAVSDIQLDDAGAGMPWDIRDGFRSNAAPVRKAAVAVGADADWFDPADHDVAAETPLPFVTDLSPRRYAVTTGGDTVLVEVPDYDADVEAVLGGDSVSAPMPGKLLSIQVMAGDAVTKGDAVAVMEAMKMEHTLSAPRDGVVASVEAAAGDQVAEGDVLVHLEAE